MVLFYVQQLINGVSRGAVYALIAVGFALIFSVLKFSNFAHGGLISVAAYAGYYFSTKFDFPPVIAILCTALIGAVMGIIPELYSVLQPSEEEQPQYLLLCEFHNLRHIVHEHPDTDVWNHILCHKTVL